MPSAVRLREDYSAEGLRKLACRSKDVNQSRRLLSLAAVRDGMDRGSAAKIGGMDRRTFRDWVHRFNASGPGVSSTTGLKVPSLAFRRSNWLSSRRSSRPVRIARRTASCAGVGSTLSGSPPRGSASTSTSAMSGRFSRNSASPTSARVPAIRRRMSGSSRRSKTYGPPRSQGVVLRLAADQSASTYPASRRCLRP
jgi:winged helix-turn helix protein